MLKCIEMEDSSDVNGHAESYAPSQDQHKIPVSDGEDASLRRASFPGIDPRQLRRIEEDVKSTLHSHGDKKQTWTFSSSGWLFV